MLKLQMSEGGVSFYEATGPLTYRDVATLRKHHWISLVSGKCRMWSQGEDGFLFNNRGHGSDKRVAYDTTDPAALAILNAAWTEYTSEPANHPNRNRRFYAAQSPRGFANEVEVHVFAARADRDAWVAAHADDGDVNSASRGAYAITSQRARAILAYAGDAATESYNSAITH